MPSELLSREPVIYEEAFWGREHEIHWLTRKLGGTMPQNCNLIGEPRIGKTSLLYQIYHKKIGLPVDVPGLYVLVRLVELPAHGSQEFWRLMVLRLQNALGVDGGISLIETLPDNERNVFDALDIEIERILEETNISRIIFLIDDFDLLVGKVTKHDLDWLRALASRYGDSLAFVISSTEPLVNLCDKIVAESDVSPFPNLFHSYWLGLLDEEGAKAICEQAADREGLALMPASLSFLLEEAGRHPDLLKTACEYFLEACAEQDEIPCYDLARTEIRLDEHVNWLCRRLWQRRSEEEQIMLSKIANGATRIENPVLDTQLRRRSGLVDGVPSDLRLFSEAFRYWIKQETVVPSSLTINENQFFEHQEEQRLVRIEDREVYLTKTDNRLLSYLLAHANEVCSTTELRDNVWDSSKQKSVVEKGINRLRAKIELDPKRPRFILSARGEGYILRTNPV